MEPVSVSAGAAGTLDVVLRGEIDYTNASEVAETVRGAVHSALPSTVRVNLADVTFLDSSGIAVLVTAMKAARETRAEYRVWAPQPRVLDQLRMTGLIDLFPVDGVPAGGAAVDGPAAAGGVTTAEA